MKRLRPVLMGLAGLMVLVLLWEGYKLVGIRFPMRPDDQSMPHVWTMVSRLFDPELRGTGRAVWISVAASAWYTFRIAFVSFVLGVAVGVLFAVLMQRFRLVERGLLPYVVVSQTVPIIAFAPVVAAWGGRLSIGPFDWQRWMSVAVVAAYLAFCPIAVGGLRGLQSPPEQQLELFRSYAAGSGVTLWKLRFPSAVPYLVPSLRLAAALSVVGTIVAEISTGVRGGLGRLLLEYSREATSDPAKVYTAMMGAAVLGLVVAGLVALLDGFLMRNRPREGEAR